MNSREGTGWAIVLIVLFLLWWLSKNALSFLHGDTTSVQTTMLTPGGGVSNTPTVTEYAPYISPQSSCCG